MERIIEILSKMNSAVDFSTAEGIISNKILDSIDLMELVSELEETFDIEIGMEYMERDNFESAQAIWEMIQDIQEG